MSGTYGGTKQSSCLEPSMLEVQGSLPYITHTTYHAFVERVYSCHTLIHCSGQDSSAASIILFSGSLGYPVMPARWERARAYQFYTKNKQAIKSSVNDLQSASLYSGVVQREQCIKAYYI